MCGWVAPVKEFAKKKRVKNLNGEKE
jgi:hypothetical protein